MSVRARAIAATLLSCLGLLAVAAQGRPPLAAGARHHVISVMPDLGAGSRVGAPVATIARISYGSGPVLHANRTHVIFWAPAGSGLSFDPGYVALVTQFMQDVARDSHMTSNELAITGQYTDASGPAAYASTFAGAVMDTDPLPSSSCTEPAQTGPGWSVCLTDEQIQNELSHEISVDSLPAGRDNIYFVVLPDGFGACLDETSSSCALGGSANGYCGYHSASASGTLYAVIPYNAITGHCQSGNPRPNASTADPALSTISHELAETVTDPYGNAWTTASGDEIADVCLTDDGRALGGTGAAAWDEVIGGHHYWLQELFSRLRNRCEPRPPKDTAAISGPRRVAADKQATFLGRGRQPGGRITAYRWSFGDGSSADGASVTHVFPASGTDEIVLRVTDSAGNWAFAHLLVRVRRVRRGR